MTTIADVKRLNRQAGGYFFKRGESSALPYVRKVQHGVIFATLTRAEYGNRVAVWLQRPTGRIGFVGALTAFDHPQEWEPHFYPGDLPALCEMVDRLPSNVAQTILKVLQRADKAGSYMDAVTGA